MKMTARWPADPNAIATAIRMPTSWNSCAVPGNSWGRAAGEVSCIPTTPAPTTTTLVGIPRAIFIADHETLRIQRCLLAPPAANAMPDTRASSPLITQSTEVAATASTKRESRTATIALPVDVALPGTRPGGGHLVHLVVPGTHEELAVAPIRLGADQEEVRLGVAQHVDSVARRLHAVGSRCPAEQVGGQPHGCGRGVALVHLQLAVQGVVRHVSGQREHPVNGDLPFDRATQPHQDPPAAGLEGVDRGPRNHLDAGYRAGGQPLGRLD